MAMTEQVRETRTPPAVPEALLRRWQDRLRTIAEDATRLHDEIADELGYERVRVEQVRIGDYIDGYDATFRRVTDRRRRVSEPGEWWSIVFGDDGMSCEYDPGEFVSRVLPIVDEPF